MSIIEPRTSVSLTNSNKKSLIASVARVQMEQLRFDENNRWFWCLCGRCHVVTGSAVFAGIFTVLAVILLGMSIFWLAEGSSNIKLLFIFTITSLLILGLFWIGIIFSGFEILVLPILLEVVIISIGLGVLLVGMCTLIIVFAIEGIDREQFGERVQKAQLGPVSDYAAANPSNFGAFIVFVILILCGAIAYFVWVAITMFHGFRYLRAKRLHPYETIAQELAVGGPKAMEVGGLGDDPI